MDESEKNILSEESLTWVYMILFTWISRASKSHLWWGKKRMVVSCGVLGDSEVVGGHEITLWGDINILDSGCTDLCICANSLNGTVKHLHYIEILPHKNSTTQY